MHMAYPLLSKEKQNKRIISIDNLFTWMSFCIGVSLTAYLESLMLNFELAYVHVFET